ncbi:MAG: hypothetical protein HKN77_05150 [Woeseiaceae bacterium]|nr:hypothetical protein [Woeseiaceae bacterium]
MDLSFQEKSAWGLLVGIGIVSYFYFPAAFDIADSVPHGAPLIAISVGGVIALAVIEAIYHTVIAVSSDDTEMDERDVLFDLKSERNAGLVLGIGLFWLVGHIIATHSIEDKVPVGGLSIAVWVLFAITVSEVAKLISQLWYYRAGA